MSGSSYYSLDYYVFPRPIKCMRTRLMPHSPSVATALANKFNLNGSVNESISSMMFPREEQTRLKRKHVEAVQKQTTQEIEPMELSIASLETPLDIISNLTAFMEYFAMFNIDQNFSLPFLRSVVGKGNSGSDFNFLDKYVVFTGYTSLSSRSSMEHGHEIYVFFFNGLLIVGELVEIVIDSKAQDDWRNYIDESAVILNEDNLSRALRGKMKSFAEHFGRVNVNGSIASLDMELNADDLEADNEKRMKYQVKLLFFMNLSGKDAGGNSNVTKFRCSKQPFLNKEKNRKEHAVILSYENEEVFTFFLSSLDESKELFDRILLLQNKVIYNKIVFGVANMSETSLNDMDPEKSIQKKIEPEHGHDIQAFAAGLLESNANVLKNDPHLRIVVEKIIDNYSDDHNVDDEMYMRSTKPNAKKIVEDESNMKSMYNANLLSLTCIFLTQTESETAAFRRGFQTLSVNVRTIIPQGIGGITGFFTERAGLIRPKGVYVADVDGKQIVQTVCPVDRVVSVAGTALKVGNTSSKSKDNVITSQDCEQLIIQKQRLIMQGQGTDFDVCFVPLPQDIDRERYVQLLHADVELFLKMYMERIDDPKVKSDRGKIVGEVEALLSQQRDTIRYLESFLATSGHYLRAKDIQEHAHEFIMVLESILAVHRLFFRTLNDSLTTTFRRASNSSQSKEDEETSTIILAISNLIPVFNLFLESFEEYEHAALDLPTISDRKPRLHVSLTRIMSEVNRLEKSMTNLDRFVEGFCSTKSINKKPLTDTERACKSGMLRVSQKAQLLVRQVAAKMEEGKDLVELHRVCDIIGAKYKLEKGRMFYKEFEAFAKKDDSELEEDQNALMRLRNGKPFDEDEPEDESRLFKKLRVFVFNDLIVVGQDMTAEEKVKALRLSSKRSTHSSTSSRKSSTRRLSSLALPSLQRLTTRRKTVKNNSIFSSKASSISRNTKASSAQVSRAKKSSVNSPSQSRSPAKSSPRHSRKTKGTGHQATLQSAAAAAEARSSVKFMSNVGDRLASLIGVGIQPVKQNTEFVVAKEISTKRSQFFKNEATNDLYKFQVNIIETKPMWVNKSKAAGNNNAVYKKVKKQEVELHYFWFNELKEREEFFTLCTKKSNSPR